MSPRHLPARDPATVRAALGARTGGVAWCHAPQPQALEELTARGGFDTHPHIRRVRPTQTTRSTSLVLATDVARAIGVDPAATGRARSEVAPADLVPALIERGITDLVLGNAWWTQPRAVADLTVTTRAAGTRLWLLGSHTVPAGWASLLDGLAGQVSVPDLRAAFADIPTHPAPPAPEVDHPWTRVPAVPTSEFVTFLTDTRRQLSPADAALVEATLRTEHARAVAWLGAHPDPTDAELAQALRARWDTCHTWPQFLTLLRAWQSAAFTAGYLLKVDPVQVAGTATAVPSAAQRTPRQWQQLAAWHDPARAAACVLVAAGIGSTDAVTLTIGDIAGDGSHVHVHGTRIDIDPAAGTYLRAQLLRRHLDSATDTDLFLLTATGTPYSHRWVVKQANEARDTFGLPLASAAISTRTATGDRWFTRWGLTLVRLP